MAIPTLFRLRRPGTALFLLLAAVAAGVGSVATVRASAISSATQNAAAYAIDPPLGVAGAAPLVMLNLSRDHQLFYKAYNDFSDLNGDSVLDTTYNNAFTYAGYFDSTKCYTHDGNKFVPKRVMDASRYCLEDDKAWSGNFLNWVSMSRMDEVRKILYGGLRSTDTKTDTVLERAFLPTDAHSFAKFYNGGDIRKLTPFTASNTRPSVTVRESDTYFDDQGYNENSTDYRLLRLKAVSDNLKIQAGDQITIVGSKVGNNPASVVTAPVRFLNTTGYNATTNRVELRLQNGAFSGRSCTDLSDCIAKLKLASTWTITNLTRTGISFCNTTVQGGKDAASATNKAPPLIRVQKGDYALWASNESVQCQWTDGGDNRSNLQSNFQDGFLSNGNRAFSSGLGSSAENPTQANGTKGKDWDELIARVQVCVSKLIGAETCKQYPDAKNPDNPYKPIGLLQKYGEIGSIKFGLVTPTFDHNASGGVLRAALPAPGTNDGDFISNEVDASTGVFKTGNGAKGIISNINALRIYGYTYGQGDSYGSNNGCTFQQLGISSGGAGNGFVSEGSCSSWGNPMAESYIETLRYLAGKKSPNPAFKSGSEDATLGLSVVTDWNDPISAANFCAPLNVINFNASSLSYDTDAVSGFTDLNSGKSVTAWTDLVGVGEGITGGKWFVGNTSATYNGTDKDLCSAKAVAAFSGLQGICPESPALKGGYLMAGAAYGAHVKRIRDLGKDATGADVVPSEDTSSLKVSTFGVQLATNTPQIRIPVPGKDGQYVTIIPAYRLTLSNGVGGGALVDFKVLSQTTDGTTAKGSFYAVWEDSFAGGDYDQDMWGIISYEITKTSVRITTKPVAASTNNGQGFGYIVSGTTKDGPHFHSGIYNFSYDDPTSPDIYNASGTRLNGQAPINTKGGCNRCNVTDPATTAVYTVGDTNAGTLQDPLLYAAKWGGFRIDPNVTDGTDTPLVSGQSGNVSKFSSDGSGTPDNYFLVTDPGKLEASLDTLFRKILAKIASGTAAATVATSATGTGITYQALYEAERTDASGKRASWIGSLSGLWTDDFGHLREDGNHNGQLDDYVDDPVVEFAFQAGGQSTVANRFTSSSRDEYKPVSSVPVELSSLRYIWSARDLLWDPTLDTGKHRPYTTAFSNANGRYIFTWVDANNDGKVDEGEVRPLQWNDTGSSGINATNYRYLNTDATGEAKNIVNWVRGTEVAGLRNRTVDYGTDPGLKGRVARLGDIVDSTPLSVSAPAEAYDLLYNDTTYATFRQTYRNRRQMVYVGANDGMLHAFNGGFYNVSCKRFTVQPDSAACTSSSHPQASLDSGFTAHPLGAEVWAYVPKNLLPHLRWMTDPNYKHTFYVDGSPIAFDAKVFKDDDTHVDGWGTLLLVPFRLGGGTITVDTATDGTPHPVTSESAYVLMDVTNPEVEPTVLAELTVPGAYTTSAPAVVAVRDAVTDSPSTFFLAIGSGPTNARKVASTANLTVRIYNVADIVNGNVAPVKTFDPAGDGGTSAAAARTSFAGDLIASDYDLDGKAERIYFGSVFGDGSSTDFGGHLWSIAVDGNADTSAWSMSQMLDLSDGTVAPNGMPVTIRPTLGRNQRGAPMVFFGTGRLFNSDDKATTKQQRMFGIVDTSLLFDGDPQKGTEIKLGNLINVTGIDVRTDKSIDGVPTGAAIPAGTNNTDLLSTVFDQPGVAGWFRNLDYDAKGINPSERVVSAQALLSNLLLTTTYVPGTSICTGLGTSNLYALDYKTGTASLTNSFGSTGGVISPSTTLGQGLPAPPSLHVGVGDSGDGPRGSQTVTACTQTSTGAIVCKDVATLKPVTSGEQSWREPQGN